MGWLLLTLTCLIILPIVYCRGYENGYSKAEFNNSAHVNAFQKNKICTECGGEFYKDQSKDQMLHYAIIKYCDCGNRIVIGYDGTVYEK